ncbi:isoprenoid synthase domain-containing protein [Cyathus striatus]|nr:isoprenoid synthase domain-containing protein [Cyathus striatus]
MAIQSTLEKTQYKLPDLFASWPWQRLLSPHFEQVEVESRTWVESFKIFGEKEQISFNKCDFNLLACLTYPLGNKDYARVACDLMNFYFVYDEYTDLCSREEAEKMAATVIDAMRNPDTERLNGDIIGEITKQWWKRGLALTKADAPCIEHFIVGFDEYIQAVAQEADDRATLRMRKVSTTSNFVEELPAPILEHPIVADITDIAAQLIGITNDMHSYRLEQARGLDGHNIISAIMFEHKLELQAALDWLGAFVEDLVKRFLANVSDLPSWGKDVDERLKVYVDGLGYWVRGNDCWCYETKRYYGDDGDDVRKTRYITLRAPEKGYLTQGQLKEAITGMGDSA